MQVQGTGNLLSNDVTASLLFTSSVTSKLTVRYQQSALILAAAWLNW